MGSTMRDTLCFLALLVEHVSGAAEKRAVEQHILRLSCEAVAASQHEGAFDSVSRLGSSKARVSYRQQASRARKPMVPETTAREFLRLANGSVGGAKVFERSVIDLRLQDASDNDQIRSGITEEKKATHSLPKKMIHLKLSVAACVRSSWEIYELKRSGVSLLVDLKTRIGWSKCFILKTDVVEGSPLTSALAEALFKS